MGVAGDYYCTTAVCEGHAVAGQVGQAAAVDEQGVGTAVAYEKGCHLCPAQHRTVGHYKIGTLGVIADFHTTVGKTYRTPQTVVAAHEGYAPGLKGNHKAHEQMRRAVGAQVGVRIVGIGLMQDLGNEAEGEGRMDAEASAATPHQESTPRIQR